MVIEAMKDAVKAAARKQFKAQDKTGDSIQVDWNTEEGRSRFRSKRPSSRTVENPRPNFRLKRRRNLRATRSNSATCF